MQDGVSISLDVASDIDALTLGLDRQSKAVSKAITRALRKTMTRLASHVKRRLQSEMQLSRDAMNDRFRTRLNIKDGYAALWLGLLPLEAQKLRKVKQNAVGVVAGKEVFEQAFMATVYSGGEKVWRRKFRGTGSTARSRAALGVKGFARKAVAGGGQYGSSNPVGRFPLEKMTVDIAEPGTLLMRQMRSEVRSWFRRLLEQELNYAITHEK